MRLEALLNGRKSMNMQMISDEMHSDTITIRQKKYNFKSSKL